MKNVLLFIVIVVIWERSEGKTEYYQNNTLVPHAHTILV